MLAFGAVTRKQDLLILLSNIRLLEHFGENFRLFGKGRNGNKDDF